MVWRRGEEPSGVHHDSLQCRIPIHRTLGPASDGVELAHSDSKEKSNIDDPPILRRRTGGAGEATASA